MGLAPNTFEYVEPSSQQLKQMNRMRTVSAEFAAEIERNVPDGPDRTYILRELRSLSMWINVAIARQADGSPRT